MRLLLLSCAASASCLLPARYACAQQWLTTPGAFAHQEGGSSGSIPFGRVTDTYRYLQVHDDVTGPARMLRGLSFRRDGGRWGPFAAYGVTLDAWISTAALDAARASATFASNHGPDRIQVVANKQVLFPDAADPTPLPAPFAYTIPFDVAFPYSGAGSICWDVRVLGQTNPDYVFHDLVTASDPNPALRLGRFGEGCRATGATAPVASTPGALMDWPQGTGTLFLGGRHAGANAAGILVVGWSHTSWFSFPLPLEIPFSAFFPSGPCNLYTNWGLTFAAQADYRGIIPSRSVPLALFTGTGGVNLFTQTLVHDPNAAGGLVTSDAWVLHFVEPFAAQPVARVLNQNGGLATGAVNRGVGLIVQFRE
jgi:hypothetical protein